MAMPTGTRSSISANSTTKPRIATASVLKCGIASLDRLDLVLAAGPIRMEDRPVGAHADKQHRRHVAEPGHQEKRPHRQPQVEGEYVIRIGAAHLVEQRV